MAAGTPPYVPRSAPGGVYSIMGVEGTLGTSDTTGTANLLPPAVDPDSGAFFTKQLSGTMNVGTVGNIDAIGTMGTLGIGSIHVTNTPDVAVTSLPSDGTILRLHDAGTLGSVANVGVVHSAGTLANIHEEDFDTGAGADTTPAMGVAVPASGGAVVISGDTTNGLDVDPTRLPDLPGGTLDLLTTVTTVNNLTNGSVRMTVGTLTTGSLTDLATLHDGTVDVTDRAARDLGKVDIAAFDVDLPGGTIDSASVVGGAASGAAASGNPVPVAGTDSGGTIYTPLVDTSGHLQADVLTLPNVTVDTFTADIPGGTTDLVTTVSNLTNGSVRMTVGTLTTGSLTNLATMHDGTVTVDTFTADIPGGTIDSGTVVGGANSAAARSGNPIPVAGTDGGGTVYIPLIDTDGHLQVDPVRLPDLPGGTLDLGTVTGAWVHAEDAVHSSGDSGIMPLGVRQDTQADFGADGDYVPLSINADGELRVTTSASSGVTHTDDAAFTVASDDVVPAAGMFDDTSPDSVDEGDAGVLRMSANRNLYTTIRDAAGNERGANVDASNNLNVILAANSGVDIGDVDVLSLPDLPGGTLDAGTVVVSTINADLPGGTLDLGTVTGDWVKAEDSVHSTGDSGVMALAVRQDAQADFGADGDYVPFSINADGQLRTSAAVTVNTEYSEDAQHATGDTGNFVMAVRNDTSSALAGSTGDYIPFTTDNVGRLWTHPETGSLSDIATVHDGTVTVDTFTADIPGGTIDAGTVVISTMNADVPGGTIDAGTVHGGAASGAAASGNPVHIAGTDSGGTVYSMLVDTSGNPQVDVVNTPSVSVSSMPSDGTITSVTDVGDVSNVTTGTLARLGTVQNLDSGTLAEVTNLNDGTVHIDPNPTQQGTPNHTRGTAGGAAWVDAIAAAGAGTRTYITGVDIVVASGTVDVAVSGAGQDGSTGDNVLARGQFVPGGGISKPLDPAFRTGTNGTISFWMSTAGTVDVTVTYWQV